jgi:hypothetical protein
MRKTGCSKRLRPQPVYFNTSMDRENVRLKDGREVDLILLTPEDTDRLLAMLS